MLLSVAYSSVPPLEELIQAAFMASVDKMLVRSLCLVDALHVAARVKCRQQTCYHGLWRVAGAVVSRQFYYAAAVVFEGNNVPLRPAEQIEASMMLRCCGDLTTYVAMKFLSYVTAFYRQVEQV
jgi:hypothetical protein